MTIYFAADHAGWELKEKLVSYVGDELGFEVVDCGAETYVPEDDYPAIIKKAAEKVSADPSKAKAIILGGSGQGEAIVANRFPQVRAVVYYGGNLDIVRLSRVHNDANVLSLGARFLTTEDAKEIVASWLKIPFSDEERHVRRIQDIDRQ
jgi:ribose 5-phosphate isomerase B